MAAVIPPKTDALLDRLKALETRSRELDSSPREVSAWLEDLGAFSGDFLSENASGPAYRGDPPGAPPELQLPRSPAPFDEVLQEFRSLVLPSGIAPTSGRFFGYVPGGGLATAAFGDYLAALTNRYTAIYAAAPGAGEIENAAVRWLIEMIGFPETAWGTLQSGGSLATLAAVVAARETRPAADWSRCVAYRTDECHLAVQKALHIAGLAQVPMRLVPVDERLRMSVRDLTRMVEEDRRRGLAPWIVFASAGTINTGAVDPLSEIADVASDADLWFHVDGAYGGFFVLTERARGLLAGLSRADSVVLDPHKGLFLPWGCGAVIVRDGALLRKGFSFTSSYLEDVHRRGPASAADYSPELTRHFRSLRLWMSLKIHGLDRFRAALEEKLILAELAQKRLAEMPRIEVGPEPELSCVAFRVRGEGDAMTQSVLDRVLGRGRVHLSSTRLWGKLYLRLCILCFRSHWDDLQIALDEIDQAAG